MENGWMDEKFLASFIHNPKLGIWQSKEKNPSVAVRY